MLKRGFVNFIKRQKFLIYERAWLVAIMVFMVNSALIAAHSENSPIKPASACLHSAKNGGSKFTNSKVDFEKLKSAFQAARDKSDFTLKKKVLETMSEFYEFYKEELNLRSLHHLSSMLSRNQKPKKIEIKTKKKDRRFEPELFSVIEEKSVVDFPSWNLKKESNLIHIRRFNEKTGFTIDSNKFKVLSTSVADSRFLFVLLRPVDSSDFTENIFKIYETDGTTISDATFKLQAQLKFFLLSISKEKILVIGDRGGVLEIKKENDIWEQIQIEALVSEKYLLSNIEFFAGNLFRIEYEDIVERSNSGEEKKGSRFSFPKKEGFLGFYYKNEFSLQKLDILDSPDGVELLVGNSKNIFLKGGKNNKALRLEDGEWREYPVSQSLKLWGHSKFGNVVAVNDNVFLNHHSNNLYKIEFDGTKFISSKVMSLKGEVVNKYAENNDYLLVSTRGVSGLITYKIDMDGEAYKLNEFMRSVGDPDPFLITSYGFLELKESLVESFPINKDQLNLMFLQEKINKDPYVQFHGENYYFLKDNYFYWFYLNGARRLEIKINRSTVMVQELKSDIFPPYIEAVFLLRDRKLNFQILEIYKNHKYTLFDLGEYVFYGDDGILMNRNEVNYSEKGYKIKDKFFLLKRTSNENLFKD